jgi:hypothetical protein
VRGIYTVGATARIYFSKMDDNVILRLVLHHLKRLYDYLYYVSFIILVIQRLGVMLKALNLLGNINHHFSGKNVRGSY